MLMIGREKKLLGISVGERGLMVAEVTVGVEPAPAPRIEEFVFAPGISFENATALGQALANFLIVRGFSARQAVYGVPAKWLICRPHAVPPADAETAANMLWLYASQHISNDLGAMSFDYIGESNIAASTTLLLVGLQQHWMDRLAAMSAGAHLKAISITPIATAIGAATAAQIDPALILSLGMEGAELTIQDGRQARSVRHIGPATVIGPLIAELRRVAVSSPIASDASLTEPGLSTTQSGRSLVLWDDVGLEPAALEALRGGAEMPLVEARPAWVWSDSRLADKVRGLAALALTLPARRRERPGIDFLHPRIAPPTTQRFGRRAVWLGAIAALVLLTILVGAADIARLQWQISSADQQLALLEPEVRIAKPYVASMQFAEGYQGGKPRYLACVRDLTLATPPDGQTYFSSLNLGLTLKGQAFGRSSTEQNVLALMAKLKATGHFTELNCSKLDVHEVAGQGKQVSFSATFVYKPQQ